jgi:ABC-2 type transport system permease protein
MVNHIKLYFILQAANLRARLEYPFNFIIGIASVVLLSLSSLVLIWVITRKVPDIAGWNFYQIAFLISVWRTSHGIFIITFQQIRNIEYVIRDGLFDRYLVRPLNPLFQYFTIYFQFAGIGDIIAGSIGIIYSAYFITDWNMTKVLLLLVVIISGAAINWSFETLLGTTAFWTLQAGGLRSIFEIFLFRFSQYPLTIYSKGIKFILTFIIPIGFMNFYPSYLFFGDENQVPFSYTLIYLSPIVAVIMVLITYKVWQKGLNAYQGAGS